jgi:hypothetical protein
MTDDDRIKRLTELAKRAWPGLDVRISAAPGYATVLGNAPAPEGQESSEWAFILLSISENPRAVEAMEAALMVLTGTKFHVMVPPTRGYVPWDRDEEPEND